MLSTLQITGAWLERDTVKVKYFAQEICNSPYCQPYNSYKVSLENCVLDQITIPKLMFFSILKNRRKKEHNTMTWPGLILRPPTQTSRQGFQHTDCKAKIFVTSSLEQECMIFFSYNNLVEPFQISIAWLSSLGARRNFRQLLKLSNFTLCRN